MLAKSLWLAGDTEALCVLWTYASCDRSLASTGSNRSVPGSSCSALWPTTPRLPSQTWFSMRAVTRSSAAAAQPRTLRRCASSIQAHSKDSMATDIFWDEVWKPPVRTLSRTSKLT